MRADASAAADDDAKIVQQRLSSNRDMRAAQATYSSSRRSWPHRKLIGCAMGLPVRDGEKAAGAAAQAGTRMAQTIEAYVGEQMDNARDGARSIGGCWRWSPPAISVDVIDFTIFGALIPDLIKSGFMTPAQGAAGSAASRWPACSSARSARASSPTGSAARRSISSTCCCSALATIVGACRRSRASVRPGSLALLPLPRRASGSAPSSRCASPTPPNTRRRRIRGRIIALMQFIGGAWPWPIGVLLRPRLPRLDRLARHLDHHRHRSR